MSHILFTNLLLAHFLADFPLQKNAWVRDKEERKLKGWGMWLHMLVVFGCAWIALGSFRFWYVAIAVALSHCIIDFLKVEFTKNGPRAFALDQLVHICVLFCVSLCIDYWFEWHQLRFIPSGNELFYPALVCAYLFCLSPANYFIREVLKYCHVEESKEGSTNINRSGMLIGSAERFLVLTFILVGNIEAAGLIVAAKSLLRFKDDDSPRTEYVLVGTLLSMIIAVLSALIVFKFALNVPIIKAP